MHFIAGIIKGWFVLASHAGSSTAPDQATAAFQLIERLVGTTKAQTFNLSIVPTDDGTEFFTI